MCSHGLHFTNNRFQAAELPKSQGKERSTTEKGSPERRRNLPEVTQPINKGAGTNSKNQNPRPLLSRSAASLCQHRVNQLLTGKPTCRGNPRGESGTSQPPDTNWACDRGPEPMVGLLTGLIGMGCGEEGSNTYHRAHCVYLYASLLAPRIQA